MSNNYLIGDTHYGHGDISQKFRKQFSSDEDHDNTIHENIMCVSGKRNNLYLLGDVFFKQSTFFRLDEYAKYFNTVRIMLGNHDHKQLPTYASQFDNVSCHGVIKRWGYWLSHAPIHPQELYRGYSIHGHVHRNTVPDSRYLNVSCEGVGYKPISLEEVREVFSLREKIGLLESKVEHND